MDEQQADTSVVTAADTIVELHRYLEDPLSREKLYGILRSYIRKAQFVSPAEVDDEAYELLQNVVFRAIEIADKYHGTGIASWLLCIAINLIRQKKKSQAVHQEKVVQLSDLHRHDYPMLSDEEFFELFTAQIAATNAQEAHLRQDLKEAITSLSEDEQLTVQFYWLPTNASWLDQIEIWFSLLQGKLLQPNHFTICDELEQAILDFIARYNQTAKPLQWSYTVEQLEHKLASNLRTGVVRSTGCCLRLCCPPFRYDHATSCGSAVLSKKWIPAA